MIQWEILCQGVSQGHHYAALDLPFYGQRINGFSDVVGRNHFFNGAVFIQAHHLGRVAVGHVGYRILLAASHGISSG